MGHHLEPPRTGSEAEVMPPRAIRQVKAVPPPAQMVQPVDIFTLDQIRNLTPCVAGRSLNNRQALNLS